MVCVLATRGGGEAGEQWCRSTLIIRGVGSGSGPLRVVSLLPLGSMSWSTSPVVKSVVTRLVTWSHLGPLEFVVRNRLASLVLDQTFVLCHSAVA